MVRILYFAYLVDKLGRAQEELVLPDGVSDVRGLLAHLRARGGTWEQALAEDKVHFGEQAVFDRRDQDLQ